MVIEKGVAGEDGGKRRLRKVVKMMVDGGCGEKTFHLLERRWGETKATEGGEPTYFICLV